MSFGDYLSSERKLSEMYSLSRTTVRLALQDLEQKGFISSIHGKGSLVIYNGSDLFDALKIEDFSNKEEYLNNEINTAVVGYNIVDNNFSSIFDCDKLIEFSQIIYINNVPSIYEKTYIPYLNMSLSDAEDKIKSLKEDVGIILNNYSSTILDKFEADCLESQENASCIYLCRKSFNKNSELLFLSELKLRIDKFTISSVKVIKKN